jgi:hypothetical protein
MAFEPKSPINSTLLRPQNNLLISTITETEEDLFILYIFFYLGFIKVVISLMEGSGPKWLALYETYRQYRQRPQ